jgi:hypothetical protein
LGSAGASDPAVTLAWAVGLVAAVVTAGLALQVLVLRERRARRERRRERFVARWRPLMFEWLADGGPPPPAIARADEESFLLLWIGLQDGVRGEPRAGLNRLAEAVGARAMALRRLADGDVLARLLALRTLGHLGQADDQAALVAWVDDPRPYLSLAAVRALVRVAPAQAPAEVLPRLARRTDWPVAQFAVLLAEADAAAVAAALRSLFPALPPEPAVRVLPLLEIVDDATAAEVLRPLLASGDPEVLAAALKRVRDPALLDHARDACRHPAWSVRTQAAAALGRAGSPFDRALLVSLLCDPEWWVRYRAAQALASGHFGAPERVAADVAATGDRFARDILAHAVAEARP